MGTALTATRSMTGPQPGLLLSLFRLSKKSVA
jgi:hypothetical protein